MADVPAVPLSKAREELVTWRQNAYKVRTEAAIKIQRWFRQGYRTASDMERLTEQQHNKGNLVMNNFVCVTECVCYLL